ncbi:MAG: hypothetical protein CMN05_09755 [Roseibacillus sp.]|jgi:hypothetical protein|nr:hypothetical protein [Roseibacillus sp.]HJM62611.1 hypothetical protein [Roseibacillus sp.]|tara:strand:- start:25102 stop:25284 length:183 start_codon:yes stop_codon:yes gene_type:complete
MKKTSFLSLMIGTCWWFAVVGVLQARSHGKVAGEVSLKVEALQELELAMEKEFREKKVVA